MKRSGTYTAYVSRVGRVHLPDVANNALMVQRKAAYQPWRNVASFTKLSCGTGKSR